MHTLAHEYRLVSVTEAARGRRNKLENVQHKKSVTDGHGRHVLESQVRGLRDGVSDGPAKGRSFSAKLFTSRRGGGRPTGSDHYVT